MIPTILMRANMDGSTGAWADMVYAFQSVLSFITGEPILRWVFLLAIVIAMGSIIGKLMGEGFKIVASIVAGVAGFGLIFYVLHSLGVF